MTAYDNLPGIEKVLRTLGRASDGYGGVAELSRLLCIKSTEPQRWRRRGWIAVLYIQKVSQLSGVDEVELMMEALKGDRRRKL